MSEIIGGGNDFYVVDVIWPFIVDPAHDKSVADASSVARQLAVSPMMLFARRLENALTQKRLHEANAAVAALFPQRGDPTARAVIEVAHELRRRITSDVGSKAENICSQ